MKLLSGRQKLQRLGSRLSFLTIDGGTGKTDEMTSDFHEGWEVTEAGGKGAAAS